MPSIGGRPDAPGYNGAGALHRYWTKGPGLARWVSKPHPWTTLYHHLLKYMPPGKAKRTTADWFHDATGLWSGERKGKNPVGPG